LADLLVGAVDLDRMAVAPEQAHHARALALEMLRFMQHHVQPARAARAQEALQASEPRGVVQPQAGAVRIEDAQLPARALEQAIDRGLEALASIEAFVHGVSHRAPCLCNARTLRGAILRSGPRAAQGTLCRPGAGRPARAGAPGGAPRAPRRSRRSARRNRGARSSDRGEPWRRARCRAGTPRGAWAS